MLFASFLSSVIKAPEIVVSKAACRFNAAEKSSLSAVVRKISISINSCLIFTISCRLKSTVIYVIIITVRKKALAVFPNVIIETYEVEMRNADNAFHHVIIFTMNRITIKFHKGEYYEC